MKLWFSIFSAVVLAGAVLIGWQRWVARWEAETVAMMQDMADNITKGQAARYRLPDPQAVDYAGTYMVRLEQLIPRARLHLMDRPPGALYEKDLRSAIAAGDAECGDLRGELAKPGNRFAAGR